MFADVTVYFVAIGESVRGQNISIRASLANKSLDTYFLSIELGKILISR